MKEKILGVVDNVEWMADFKSWQGYVVLKFFMF